LDVNDRIQSYEQIECPDDAAAVLKVDELLAASRYGTAELWQGKRLVGKWGTESGHAGMKLQAHSEQGAPGARSEGVQLLKNGVLAGTDTRPESRMGLSEERPDRS
jgi:hypothetical protein